MYMTNFNHTLLVLKFRPGCATELRWPNSAPTQRNDKRQRQLGKVQPMQSSPMAETFTECALLHH